MKKNISIAILFISLSLFATQFGKNKVQIKKDNWIQSRSLHFDVYVQKENEEFLKTAILLCENAYYKLKDDFNVPLRERIPVIFYNNSSQFQSTNIVPPLLSSGVQGFTERAKNRVVIPFDGSYLKLEEILTHELTHAYINGIDGGNTPINLITDNFRYPFWFSEGLPEFEALNSSSVYNNMFILDKILNGKITPLNSTYNYYAYRQGESFLSFISKKYGRDKVMSMFYGFHQYPDLDAICDKYFSMKFNDLEDLWKSYLRRKYFPKVLENTEPIEKYSKITNFSEDGSSVVYSPRFSPDGNFFLYFSNEDLRLSIYKNSELPIFKQKKIIQGESTGKIEEFHYQETNISWFADNKTFAFSAHSTNGDVIYFADVIKKKIIRTLNLGEIEVIGEIDISPDQKSIVMSAQKNLQTDLFIIDIETEKLTQIIDDSYKDYQPRWSDTGNKIVFSSERSILQSENEFIFYNLSSDIFSYDISSKQFTQITFDRYNNNRPICKDEKVFFVSESDSLLSIDCIDFSNSKRAKVIDALSGILTYDINSDLSKIIFSVFYNGGWDIYIAQNPLSKLEYLDYQHPKEIIFEDDFYEAFNISRYKKFGYKERHFKKLYPKHRKNTTVISFNESTKKDSIFMLFNEKIDKRPTTSENPPKIEDYKIKFGIDNLWGGIGYSSYSGFVGQLQATLSDIMGDHYIAVQTDISSEWEDSDVYVRYYYFPYRLDFGIGGFYLNDYLLKHYTYEDVYLLEKYKNTGLFTLTSYPFNRYWRLDLQTLTYQFQARSYLWDDEDDNWIYLHNKYTATVFSPQLSLIHDNILYGPTGPISGWRSRINVSYNLTDVDDNFVTTIFDYRNYFFFMKKFALASRFYSGHTTGASENYFDLDNETNVRGYDNSLEGDTKIISSLELRVPFVEHLKLFFPIPLEIGNIRGSVFMDAGAVWNADDKFNFVDNGRFDDIKFGFGFGPRVNLGLFILKLDVAWNHDLVDTSKPSYYLHLTEDF